LESDSLIRKWADSFQIDISQEFGGQATIELRQCVNCHLSYFLPKTLAGSPGLYAALQAFDWYYLPRKWEHDAALRELNGCRRGLEVGCGFGDFVARVAREKGIPFEGCEQNAKAVEVARERGVTVHTENAELLAESYPHEYDVVCAFQVLEHVSDPAGFLTASCKLLRSGGKLILGLPNARSFLRHQFNPLDMPPHHMSRWSAEVLKRMQGFFPLKLIRVAYEPLADYHVGSFVEAYTDVLARGGLRFLAHPGIRSRVARLIRKSGAQRILRGQTIYACYVRL